MKRAPFQRLVKNILQGINIDINHVQRSAFECLQEAAESYIVSLMGDANICAIHCNRQTIMQKDFLLARRLRGDEARENITTKYRYEFDRLGDSRFRERNQ